MENEHQNSNFSENKPLVRGNVIFRQELKSLTPKCDIKCAICCNIIFLVLFLAFGIPIIMTAHSVIEFSTDYSTWYEYNIYKIALQIMLNVMLL